MSVHTTLTRNCDQCGGVYQARKDSLKAGKGRYCSRACSFEAKKRRVVVTCGICGREFETIRARVKNPKTGRFCGVSCRLAYMKTCRRPLADRFWEKVAKTDNCWIWTGASADGGYGQIGSGGRDGRDMRATHVAWGLAYGPVPDGMWVLHKCDNPPCVRPDHLFLGTNRDNVDDRVSKGRQRRGESAPLSKLTDAQVAEMRRRFDSGEATRSQLARETGIHYQTAVKILNRQRWTHVP